MVLGYTGHSIYNVDFLRGGAYVQSNEVFIQGVVGPYFRRIYFVLRFIIDETICIFHDMTTINVTNVFGKASILKKTGRKNVISDIALQEIGVLSNGTQDVDICICRKNVGRHFFMDNVYFTPYVQNVVGVISIRIPAFNVQTDMDNFHVFHSDTFKDSVRFIGVNVSHRHLKTVVVAKIS